LARERVIVHSDGLRLVGDLYLPEGKGPWPGLVLCHGLASRKERHAAFASYAAARGFVVLVYDGRGHGESEGQLDGRAVFDVGAAVAYLKARPEVAAGGVAVRGSSLGGSFALHRAAASSDISAVVAICPAPESILLEGLRQAISNGISITDVRLEPISLRTYLREHDVRDVVGRIAPRPVLLIHCAGDEVIPASITQELYSRASEPKELWLLPGGTHTTAQHDVAIHERTVDWLRRRLTP
jgi:uncharacterized protein